LEIQKWKNQEIKPHSQAGVVPNPMHHPLVMMIEQLYKQKDWVVFEEIEAIL
jgi:hypothetical protein